MLTISQKKIFPYILRVLNIVHSFNCVQGTLLRSLKRLSGFKFLNDLVLMIVYALLVECLQTTLLVQ